MTTFSFIYKAPAIRSYFWQDHCKPGFDLDNDGVEPHAPPGHVGSHDGLGFTAEASPRVLDPCSGSRMMWFDRGHPDAVFGDRRRETLTVTDRSHGRADGTRTLKVDPDMLMDFRALPFEDGTFRLVAFDPPHLVRAGPRSWLAAKYGKLGQDWRDDLRAGFAECFRVLHPDGVLVFKWNETQVKLREVLALTPHAPLFGNTSGKKAGTHWLVFMKPNVGGEFRMDAPDFLPCGSTFDNAYWPSQTTQKRDDLKAATNEAPRANLDPARLVPVGVQSGELHPSESFSASRTFRFHSASFSSSLANARPINQVAKPPTSRYAAILKYPNASGVITNCTFRMCTPPAPHYGESAQ